MVSCLHLVSFTYRLLVLLIHTALHGEGIKASGEYHQISYARDLALGLRYGRYLWALASCERLPYAVRISSRDSR